MISIKELRQDPDSFKDRLALKGEPIDLKSILSADRALRALKTQVNDLRADRNNASESIGLAKKSGKDASDAINKTRELGDHLKEIETELNKIETHLS